MRNNKTLIIGIGVGVIILMIVALFILLTPRQPESIDESTGFNSNTEEETGSATVKQLQFRSSGPMYDKLLPDQYDWVKAELGRFSKMEKGEDISYFTLKNVQTQNNGDLLFNFTIDTYPETFTGRLELRPKNELNLTIPKQNYSSNNQKPINEGSFDEVHTTN